jgi:hypothetical protein
LEAGVGFDDGILDFEEVEGVEVTYETTDGGRVVKFNVSFIPVYFYSIEQALSIRLQLMKMTKPKTNLRKTTMILMIYHSKNH